MPRYFLRAPNESMLNEAMTMLADRAVEEPPKRARTDPRLLIAELAPDDVQAFRRSGVEVFEDIEFSTLDPVRSSREYWADGPGEDVVGPDDGPSLTDVLEHIRAPEAWRTTRGEGVTIAVVDTGTCGSLDEFPDWKKSPLDLPTAYEGSHWNDNKGHGSMCAAVAAATSAEGGRFDGVAPDATVISARTTLMATDIFDIYDELIAAKRDGTIAGPLVISNSYGLYRCDPPPGIQQDHPYLGVVLTAVDDGIPVVFAAGNNHHDVLCNHDAGACGPTTIWAVNSHDSVLSVGTVNADETNRDGGTPHANSSRGPGQWARNLPKPDCVAPTYGTVVWGCGYRTMDWWGTSGACPQVAGLAALLLAVDGTLTPDQVGRLVRETCRDIGAPHDCVGHGLIDCAAAVDRAVTMA